MSNRTTWAPLPGTHHDLPRTLLIGFSFANDGYTIMMTDLANIWAETLSRRELCIRALNEDTSIDPTGGSTQLKIFMDKIRSALDQTLDEHDQTSLTLAGGSAKGAATDQEDMVLRITCVLPKPLKPLQWPVFLRKQSASYSAEHMVLPVLRSHHSQQERNEELISCLKEKDAVITKLIDKLEAMGTSLDNIFPALSGKKKVTREVAEQKIKGLVPFDEAAMLSRNITNETPSNAPELIEQVFGSHGSFQPSVNVELDTAMEAWWTKLDQVDGVTLVKRHQGESGKAKTPSSDQASGGDDDNFQVQSTPPHLMSAKDKVQPTSSAVDIDDDSTEDEDPSQIPDSHPPPRKSPIKAKPNGKPGRLGVIGGKKAAPPPPPTPPPKSPTPEPVGSRMDIDDDDDATASEAEEKVESSPPPPPSPPKETRAAPKRGGLGIGRIRGKHKPSSSPADETSNTAASSSASQDTSKPAKHRLGHIGGKAKADAVAVSKDRGRQESPAKRQEVRETSVERADRKRAELQKELEKKAAAGPAKKKRKF